MNCDSSAPRYAAGLVGTLARQVLSVDSGGHILAGLSRALYLQSAGGDLLWLAPGDVPMHRRGVRVSAALPRAQQGSTYRVTDDGLLLGSKGVVDLSRASTWKPPHFSGQPRLPDADISAHLARVSTLLLHLPSPTGFGAFLPGITDFFSGGPLPAQAPRQDPVMERALPAVRGIARACSEHDLAALLEQAEGLVGLGEGLTPCGDDFIGGVLFGLAMLQEASSPFLWYSRGAVLSFLDMAKTRTNLISFAHLSDHAAGHASEVLHRFVLALLAGRSLETTHRAASELVRLGHSTGWGLLTGAWTAIALVPWGATPIQRQACALTYAATH